MSTSLLAQFSKPRNKTQVFLDKYQYVLSIVATFLFFSDLPDYLFAAPLLPIVPLIWIGVIAFLSIPFYKKAANIPKPLLIWMVFYLLISILSLMTVSGDEISFTDFRAKALSVLYIVLMYALYQQKSTDHIKYTLIVVVLMTTVNNIIELLNPKIFTEANVGRPAGFYIDPNKTGCAIMLGMLLGITIIKKPYRWILVLISAVGIMATFSRGAIIGWVICTLFLIIGQVLSDQRRKIVVPAIILIIFLISINPLQLLADYFKGDTSGGSWDIVNRLEEFQNPSLSEDSAMSRQAVAAGAWLLFSKNPLWGGGLASTRKWMVADVSTHNMYLYHMADNGILGLIFLPGAIVAVIYRNRGEQVTILICFGFFVGLWGLFSHEVLTERYILTIFALLAAMNTNQQWYLKYTNRNLPMGSRSSSPQLLLPSARNKTGSKLLIPTVRDKKTAQLLLPPARNQKFIPKKRD
jgi:O-antigen ligase